MVDPFSHAILILQQHSPTISAILILGPPGSTAMMLGYQASDSENAYDFFFLGFFFSIRPTDPISGNAFHGKRKKKKGMTLASMRLIFLTGKQFSCCSLKFSKT